MLIKDMEVDILEIRKAIIAYEECKYNGLDRRNVLTQLQRRCIDLEQSIARHLKTLK